MSAKKREGDKSLFTKLQKNLKPEYYIFLLFAGLLLMLINLVYRTEGEGSEMNYSAQPVNGKEENFEIEGSGSDQVNSPYQLGNLTEIDGGVLYYGTEEFTVEAPLAGQVLLGCSQAPLSDIKQRNPSQFSKSKKFDKSEMEDKLAKDTEIFVVFEFPEGEGEVRKIIVNNSDCPNL